jgi:hypothetical protein
MSNHNQFVKATTKGCPVWTVKHPYRPSNTESLGVAESHEQLQAVHTERRTDQATQTDLLPSTFKDSARSECNNEGTTEILGSFK